MPTTPTPTPTVDQTPGGPRAAGSDPPLPSSTRLVVAHTKAQVLDLVRTPVSIVSTTIFPTMAFLFFVLPQSELISDPFISLTAAAMLGTFGVMSAYLFNYGIGVADDRANPWSTYLRSLPAGAVPPTVARFLTAALSAVLSFLPLVLVVALLTTAPEAFTREGLPWWRLLAGLGAMLLSGLPFLGMGLLIGYLTSAKAAVAVAQVVNFPLAFVGGMLLTPLLFPAWLDAVSQLTPARASRDLVVTALTGAPVPATTVPVFLAWSAAMLALAVWAHRRDEGRRFR